MANVTTSIRMDAETKKAATELLNDLGLDLSSAVNIFLKQVILQGGLPFQVKYPQYRPEVLEAMEEAQGYADDDSPTKRPGSDKSSDSSAENIHGRPMLSLENTYDINDVTKWYNDMVKATGNPKLEVIVNPKWDGGSCAIRMKHGVVTKALTRGDGTVGEDITANTALCLKEISAKNSISFS